MIYIKQHQTTVKAEMEGDFPDLVIDLAIAYRILSARGAALGIDVARLVEALGNADYIAQIAEEYERWAFPT